jgi:hypothetical protein
VTISVDALGEAPLQVSENPFTVMLANVGVPLGVKVSVLADNEADRLDAYEPDTDSLKSLKPKFWFRIYP